MADLETTQRLPVVLLYNLDPEWDSTCQHDADRASRRLGYAMRKRGHSVAFLPVSEPDLTTPLSAFDPGDVIVFNWCEEVPGVDHSESQVAAVLESLDFTYTGASAEALALSCDKPRVMELLKAAGVPVPAWRVFSEADGNGWDRFPAIVKPTREHCSIGISRDAVVMNPDELAAGIARMLKEFRQPALVEEFIDGREFHVPLWGNETVEMLPPVERDFSALENIRDRLCTYDSKFEPDSPAYKLIKTVVPTRLDEKEQGRLEAVCVAAYRALGCRDYGRIDVRMRDGEFYVLDVNPNADLSSDASWALAAQKAGYCYGAMGSRMLEFAAERHPQNLAPHQ